MSKFVKDANLMSGKGENDVDWITVKGSHIPIKDGETVEEVLSERFGKDKENKKLYSDKAEEIKMSKGKRKALNEFRYNYNQKHTNYVFEDDGNKYHSIGLTHQKATKDKNNKVHNNMQLNINAKKNANENSFVRYGIITDKKQNYSSIDKRFQFSDEDFKNVKAKIRNYKKNRKKR